MEKTSSLQDCLELLLLLCRQAGGELDLDAHNEVAALTRLLALRHTQVGVSFCPSRPRRPTASHAELFAVDGLYSAAPASERFLEIEFDDALNVIAFAGEKRVWFLCRC